MKNPQKQHYALVKNVIESKEFQARKNMKHHGTISVYDHSYRVSLLAYKMALVFRINPKETAIAALLHDFYITPWQDSSESPFFHHGLKHAQIAADNALKTYGSEIINKRVYSSIKTHMWPINLTKIPKSRADWIVNLADDIVSIEVFKQTQDWPAFLGLDKKKSRTNPSKT
jgi:uncharacterized protein